MSPQDGTGAPRRRPLVRETPVAIVCNGATLGVMMASPDHLEDYAIGFALTEGVLECLDELRECQIVAHAAGIEARLWLNDTAAARVHQRQRAMIGPVGCGLCGIDSLAKVARPLPRLPDSTIGLELAEARLGPSLLRAHQPEHDRTRACHAAGFLMPGYGIVVAREDVGRHNALDKLVGAIIAAGPEPADGAIVVTSRVSAEIVQKTVAIGAPVLIAVSRATDYAVQVANECNLTVLAGAGRDGEEVLSAPERLGRGPRYRPYTHTHVSGALRAR